MVSGAYLTGAFGQSQNLYQARNEAKRGRGSQQAVQEQMVKDTKEVVTLQQDAHLDYIADPMFPVFYLFQPFAESVEGVQVGPQENWFNNNMFYWRPQIQGPLKIQTGFTERYLHSTLLPRDKMMAILPSPYTLLMLSDVHGYSSPEKAVTNLAELLFAEALHLASAGFQRIQYDEPVIAVKQSLDSLRNNDLMLLQRAMEVCGHVQGATTSLHTYFGDAGPLIPYLMKLPVDCVGIDCTETRLDDLTKYRCPEKELALGLLNARATSVEDCRELIAQAKIVAEKTRAKKIWVTPNTGTEYRGFTNGVKKLALLGKIREMLHE